MTVVSLRERKTGTVSHEDFTLTLGCLGTADFNACFQTEEFLEKSVCATCVSALVRRVKRYLDRR